MTTTETAVQPAAGSHPYPDLTSLPVDFYKDPAAKYEAMAAADRLKFDEWEIAARSRVFPQPGRHAKPASVAAVADSPARALTVPDALPVPLAPPAAAVPDLPRRRPSVFARHLRRDRAPEGRNGTAAPPVPAGDEAPTILPGSVGPVPALDPRQDERLARFNDAHDAEPPAGDWVDKDADRAGRSSSGFFDSPDQGESK